MILLALNFSTIFTCVVWLRAGSLPSYRRTPKLDDDRAVAEYMRSVLAAGTPQITASTARR